MKTSKLSGIRFQKYMRIKNNMKKILSFIIGVLLVTGIAVEASDLIIESKNQNYVETDQKIKFNGDVKVTIDDLKVVGDKADVNVINGQKLDTATFYDKPYAYIQ